MKLPSRVDGSICGAVVLSTRPSASLPRCTTTRRLCAATGGRVRAPSHRPARSFFCPQTSLWLLSTFMPAVEGRPILPQPQRRQPLRAYSSAAAPATRTTPNNPTPPPNQDKDHLLSFVVGDPGGSTQEYFDFHRDPYLRKYAPPNTAPIQVSEQRHDVEYPSRDSMILASDEVRVVLDRLYYMIGSRQRHPTRHPLEPIYKTYTQLPEPRMLYLSWRWRNRLLRIMGTPRKRDMESMLRYFTLVADVKNSGITLRRSHWNFALVFATKYVARAGSQEMESGLRIWREMERDADVKANEVTFNVLFDVAAKAGNFKLADMLYREMEHRGIGFNRFHHVSLIHYFGLRLDSDGIRAAYREMVNAGEMIDTVVLNCVISGLLRCGEEAEAEETYRRMKNDHASTPAMPPRDYMVNKVVTRVLMMFSKIGKTHPDLKESFQMQHALTPNMHTYKLLVEHFAIKVGDLTKVAQYLDEMKHLGLPLHPTFFLALFKGFFSHGGFEGSAWSTQRLESVLHSLYTAYDENAANFSIGRWLVIWALRAVYKCSSQQAVIEVFDEMSRRWDVAPDREEFMHAIFDNILTGKDMASPSGTWGGPPHRRRKRDGSPL